MNIEIPDELPLILRNFTLSVLRNKPKNIIAHAVSYFVQLQQQQQSGTMAQTSTPPDKSLDPDKNLAGYSPSSIVNQSSYPSNSNNSSFISTLHPNTTISSIHYDALPVQSSSTAPPSTQQTTSSHHLDDNLFPTQPKYPTSTTESTNSSINLQTNLTNNINNVITGKQQAFGLIYLEIYLISSISMI
ncbi:unnamed protein product [Didymodactylos carnosus]|uniref:RIIa domain-containing protein n=1 Tax=Didymodactylos carnosus TaxID=1234261 RepID=A0A814BR85_9BILA|nr:unnamed protein product [Didymodactylos carnosus]CAF1567300.1 unnamed protein product [Didymodactylos carnosus]CAF3710047.1 unnamed protein product [Didymodactylos carnosus]CAF4360724.1 unnamed protein product [Didymodactylos carnosus]